MQFIQHTTFFKKVMNLFFKKVSLKSGLLFLLFFTLLFIVGTFILVDMTTDGIITQRKYTQKDMIHHYENNQIAILEIRDFINSKVDNNDYLEIVFKDKKIDLFLFKLDEMDYEYHYHDIKINSKETSFILKSIDWTQDDLITLKSKLDKADCISVSSKNPITIGWKKRGSNIYYYKIYDKDLSDHLDEYDNGCSSIFYKKNIVLEYKEQSPNSPCFPKD